jgi:predicted TIM-barrel fold metal-dependent hydrolase
VRPKSGKTAVTTLRKAVEEQGFKALMLHTSDDSYTLKDRSVINPLIEEASRLRIPVMFNAMDASWASCTPSMVADVAVDYPDVTFVIGRMGFGGVNGWPGSPAELLPAMKKAPNTVTETASVFNSKFIQDTIDAVGVDRVLMGSNAPYFPLELSKITVIKNLNKMTGKQKAQVAGGNLARLLKIG